MQLINGTLAHDGKEETGVFVRAKDVLEYVRSVRAEFDGTVGKALQTVGAVEQHLRVCSWCDSVTGTWEGPGTTHGICPECKEKLREKHGL